MEFNSLFFFLTLLPLLVLHRCLVPVQATAAKVVVLLYSWFFYGMWNPPFLILLLVSTLVDYFVALAIGRWPEARGRFLLVSLVANLGMLGFFKYFAFVTGAAAAYLGVTPPRLEVVLPVGISFYTFQTLSYSIDVYRGVVAPRRSLLDVAFFVAYFPQLVAGPILRAREFLPQIEDGPRLDAKRLADGTFFVLFGLCLKCVLADNLAPRVEELFDGWRTNGTAANWAAGMLFGAQIYADFAGYSLIALGLGRLMGYTIPLNFRAPFGARSVTEFWRRWHVSLSSWLRDYLYIPLGGNRTGRVRTYVNVLITMVLGGLWHGAGFLFIAWGALHGVIVCVERALGWADAVRWPRGRAVVTYLMLTLTWIPFRAASVEQCLAMLAGSFHGNLGFDAAVGRDLFIGAVVGIAHYLCRERDVYGAILTRPALQTAAIAAGLLLLYYGAGGGTEFIYFRF